MRKYLIQMAEKALELPTIFWVLVGLVFVYQLYFIDPIFLNPNRAMLFPQYVPIQSPIGIDQVAMRNFIIRWLSGGEFGAPYPPLSYLLYMPFTAVSEAQAYAITTLLSLICFILITIILPIQMSAQTRTSSLWVLMFATGIFSYGFQFELERGQFNVIAMAAGMAAVTIYRHHPRWHWLAYVLLFIAVQLKIYPAILILMLVDNWSDWKGNARRFILFGAACFAGLFMLGTQVFREWQSVFQRHLNDMSFAWVGNHSIKSFTIFYADTLADWHIDPGTFSMSLLVLSGLLVCMIGYLVYIRRDRASDAFFLIGCTVCMLVVPSVSHDYTLPLLAGPMAILLSSLSSARHRVVRSIQICLIVILAAAYASTLFSFTNKPPEWGNNFPALLLILLVTCGLAAIQYWPPTFDFRWDYTRHLKTILALIVGIGVIAAVAPPVINYVNSLPIRPPTSSIPATITPRDVQFDGEIRLAGYTVRQNERNIHLGSAGAGEITITFYWNTLAVPTGDYIVFVHVVDENGTMVTQSDHPPFGEQFPTTVWESHKIYATDYQLVLPVGAANLKFYMGMYRWPSLERLPATAGGEPVPDNRVPLAAP
jgi:hypothetical protein